MNKFHPKVAEVMQLFVNGTAEEKSWAGRWLLARKGGARSANSPNGCRATIAAVNARRAERARTAKQVPPASIPERTPLDDPTLVLSVIKLMPTGISSDDLNAQLLARGLGAGRVNSALITLRRSGRIRDECRASGGGRITHLWFAR